MVNASLESLHGLAGRRRARRAFDSRSRRTPPVSHVVAAGLLRFYDALALAAVGFLTWQIAAAGSSIDLAALAIIALGALLAPSLLRRFGASRLEDWRVRQHACHAAWLVTMLAMLSLVWLAGDATPRNLKWLAMWFAGGAAALAVGRASLAFFVRRWRYNGRICRRIAVVGAGPIGQRLLRELNAVQDGTIAVAGVYDDRRSRLPPRCMGHAIRGTVDDLIEHARANQIDTIAIALPLMAEWRLNELMRKINLVPVEVRLCADMFGFGMRDYQQDRLGPVAVLGLRPHRLADWRRIGKAVEDRALAALILVLVMPVMLVAAALVRLDSPGPILFRQKRYGFNNRVFEVLKFRTLYHDQSDPNAERLSGRDDPRVTRVGGFLRRTMIDELPQFINVLRGEMSIVGPRPHAMAAKAGGVLYRDAVRYYDARHCMKPGITGWAQVNGWHGETRTLEDIRQRVAHDLYYIEHWSIPMDLAIIFRTAAGRLAALLPIRKLQTESHAMPLADSGRPRSAA